MLLVPALVVSSVLEIFNSFVGEGAKDEDDEVDTEEEDTDGEEEEEVDTAERDELTT